MGLKKIQRLNEGPFDFARGMAGAAGQKMGNAARGFVKGVANTVGDIAQAGRTASIQGDLDSAVAKLAKLIVQYDQLNSSQPDQENSPEQPQQPEDKSAVQPSQTAQQERNVGGVAQAFQSQGKPKARSGQYGPEWTFNSFLQATHGEQLDEGVWDFVKGAGAEVGNKIRDKINSYAERPSIMKDLYRAGAKASAEGDLRSVKENTLRQLALVIQALKQSVGDPQQVLQTSVQRSVKDPQQASRVIKLVMSNINKQR